MDNLWKKYESKKTYDEYLNSDRKLRKQAIIISHILERHGIKKLNEIEKNCVSTISARGINFRVYESGKKLHEKKWPLDIIPRILLKKDWAKVSKGLLQRVKALNLFIDDVYNDRKIFKDNIIPEELVFKSPYYLRECYGFSPKYKAWSNISGVDLIRNIDGEFKEDAVFNFIIDISNLKILPGDYDVQISSKLITQFSHKELSVKYWIALEKSSTYGV